MVQPRHDRLTDISWQRQAVDAGTFAPDHRLPGSPVDVPELQGSHFTGPQSEAHQHRQDGKVPLTDWSASVTALHQSPHMVRLERLRQCGEAPAGDRGNRLSQRSRRQMRIPALSTTRFG
jgi:hypothetical protein